MQATMGSERVPATSAETTGTAGGVDAGRARRWRRTLAGYTANVTTYVAEHVVPARRRARPALAAAPAIPTRALGAVSPAAPVATATPSRRVGERDGRWPVHVATAVARILIAIDWALPGGGRGARDKR